jgi:hypothetical protein
MEQGQYQEDNFGNSNQSSQSNQSNKSNQGGQPYPGGQPTQAGQAPFIPARTESGPAKQSQAKAIIILLVCILAVNVATFVMQNFLPRSMTFSGSPGFGGGGMVTQGNGSGSQQQQTPPDFGQQDGETPPDFGQLEE